MNKKLLVVYNPKKENVKEIVKKITLKIKNLCNVEICSSEKINYKICNADLILTLGGDGTILKVGQYAVLKSIPVLGANLGGLGYLAEFQVGEIFDVIKKFFLGEITPQERMVLSIIYKNREFFAINDVVVKPFSSKVCNVEVKIDKKKNNTDYWRWCNCCYSNRFNRVFFSLWWKYCRTRCGSYFNYSYFSTYLVY